MHLAIEEYLNEKNIDTYLHRLAEVIEHAGIGPHQVLIVGGAAMALKFHDGRSTVDIDICIREQNHLYECCQKVAEAYNLPDDWMNADVMHSESFSYRLFDHAVLYKEYGESLKAYVVDDLDHYCMKLISFRPKDVQDMEILSQKLRSNGVRKDDVEKNFLRLYGDLYLMKNDDRKENFFHAQFKDNINAEL